MRTRSVAAAVAWRNLHNFFTNPALLLPALLFPLFFFTAFAGGLSRVDTAPGFDFPSGYTAFQFVFVLLQASAFGGVFTGFAMARDFESGFGRRMMLAAPNRLGILGGYAISAIVRAVFVWVLLTTIALVAGMEVGGAGVDLVGLYALAALSNFAALMWAAGVALRFRSIQAGPLMQTPDLHDPVPRACLRAAGPPQRLGERRRRRQPGDRDGGGRTRPDLRRRSRTRRSLSARPSGSPCSQPRGRCAACAAPRRPAGEPCAVCGGRWWGSVRAMIEEAGSNDPQVDDLENTADELAHHGDKLQDDIEDTRDDWESKKESQAVPGAVPDPDDEEDVR